MDRIDRFIADMHQATPEVDIASYGIWGRIALIREMHFQIMSNKVKPLGLTFNEWQIIGILYLSGFPYKMNPTQLTKQKIMTSGGVTNLLSKMENNGLITREPSLQDRRGVIVQLTEQGLARAKASLDGNPEQALLRSLTPEEIEVLNILLRKLLKRLDDEN